MEMIALRFEHGYEKKKSVFIIELLYVKLQ